MSTKKVARALSIELVEVPDWNCCGATAGHSTSHLLAVALGARNLAQAETLGLDIVAPCAACYQRLVVAEREMKENPEIREKINGTLARPYEGNTHTYSLVEVIAKAKDQIENLKVRAFTGLKVAAYYGCLLVKPPRIMQFDDPENPQILDDLVKATGAEAVDWSFKTECCGGALAVSNTEIVLKLTRDILRVAKDRGADVIVTACPLCQSNLDTRQGQIKEVYGDDFNLPILYFTELIGLALGLKPEELGLNTHFVSTKKVLEWRDAR
jgi:heterodisulfide reductase subunit B